MRKFVLNVKGKRLLWIPLVFIVSIAMVGVARAQVYTKLYVDPEKSTAFVDETFLSM